MHALYLFLFLAALYAMVAYELVTSMAKFPKSEPRAQWPEKGGTHETHDDNRSTAGRSAR